MGELVMGITVTGDDVRVVSSSTKVPHAAAHRDLYVRHREARPYVPSGPGFYLEGVSKTVEPAGPPLVVTRGETTAITVHNELDEPTAIHWHGIEIESYYDGVPGWNGTPQHATPYIKPGDSFVAYMTPPRAGTFIYHTHWHDVKQLTGGLYGPLLVLEPGQSYNPETDKVFVVGRGGPNEMQDPLLLNGTPQPPIMVLLTGKTYRLRFVNITPEDDLVTISLSSEGHLGKWRAVAKDGADLPSKQGTMRDSSQDISVGETYDFEFSPDKPGNYILRFCSSIGTEISQSVVVVPPNAPFSVFAKR
jgi:FtsP/CotA-like multicopper oxidase with cupredoxin domain